MIWAQIEASAEHKISAIDREQKLDPDWSTKLRTGW